MKKFLLFILLFGIATGLVAQPKSSVDMHLDSLQAMGVGKLSVNAPTKDEIRDYIRKNIIIENAEGLSKYSVQPRMKQPLEAGRLSSEFIDRGLNAVNVMRFIAGIDEVSIDTSNLHEVQTATLMCALTKIDRTSPKNPDGMKKDVFKQSVEIFQKSMLSVGSESIDRAVVTNFMSSSKDEMDDMGNRRSIIDPKVEQVAFGHVGKYALMNVVKKSDSTKVNYGMVAWPAQNTPLDYFDISSPLSVMFSEDYDIKGNVVLVMVRQNDGKIWKFGRLLPKQDGFYSTSTATSGMPNCIAWKPNLDQYHANDLFSVHISGVKYKGIELPTIEYTISFFNLFTVLVNGYLNIMEPISSIGSNDYKGNSSIISVDIANSVRSIDEGAFVGCKNLERVKFPDEIKSISKSAFKGCISLKSVQLPNSVISIADDAFAGCSSIEQFGISYKLKVVGNASFRGCSKLTKIDLPESLEQIGANAFAECIGLTKVELPKNISLIGTGAFSGCTSLKEIAITDAEPATLEIKAHAFQNCTSIDSIYISKSVVSIEEYAFDGCSSLKVIHIAEGVKRIAENAFTKTALQRIYIPSSVTSIGRVSAIPSTAIIYCRAGSYAEKWAKGLYRKYVIMP